MQRIVAVILVLVGAVAFKPASSRADMSGIRVKGNPSEIFYFERGGRLVCTHASLSGATSTVNPVVVLRLHRVDGSANFRVHCDIDGSAGGSGGVGGNFRLLQMDGGLGGVGDSGDSYIELSGTIAPTDYVTPIVIAHGACSVVLRGVHGLLPSTLRMIGHIISTAEHRTCNIHLDGCSLLNCTKVSDVIESGSSGPLRLTWSHCQKMAFGGNYAQPFADGAVNGGDVIGGVTIPGSTPDLIP
jgi:hypothetical protein